MKIQDRFDYFLKKIKNAIAVSLVDDEGEIILYSFNKDSISDDDVRLFSAHIVHTMAKTINSKNPEEMFFYNDRYSAFTKRLKENLVLLIIFEGTAFKGYARLHAEDIIEQVEEEFF